MPADFYLGLRTHAELQQRTRPETRTWNPLTRLWTATQLASCLRPYGNCRTACSLQGLHPSFAGSTALQLRASSPLLLLGMFGKASHGDRSDENLVPTGCLTSRLTRKGSSWSAVSSFTMRMRIFRQSSSSRCGQRPAGASPSWIHHARLPVDPIRSPRGSYAVGSSVTESPHQHNGARTWHPGISACRGRSPCSAGGGDGFSASLCLARQLWPPLSRLSAAR